MRTERVVTNRRCNQGCLHCIERRPEEDPTETGWAAVARAIEAVAGADELCLTGGEPTMRRDLERLVRHARALGVGRVVVESNATLIDARRARALRQAGVSAVRAHVAAAGDAADSITRDPGGAARARRGLQALREAAMPIEASTALIRPALASLADLPGWLHEILAGAPGAGGPLAGPLWVAFPVTAPDQELLLSLPEAAAALARLDAQARRHGIDLKLRPDAPLPPCVFPNGSCPAHLYSMSGPARAHDERTQLGLCGDCVVRDRCQGFDRRYLRRFGEPSVEPLTDGRLRRRLALIESVGAQIARELVAPNRYVTEDGRVLDETIVRVCFHCNQRCEFCFVSTHLPPPAATDVRQAIVAAARAGHRVCLSGGEPTLDPELPAYVRLAHDEGAAGVQLQTNAVRLDDPSLVRALVGAGLREAFVALHASTPALSDALTGAPGSFARTTAGIDALAAAGLELTLNFVMTRRNLHELVSWVRLCAARWPRARLSISFVAPSTDLVPAELVPRFAEAVPTLLEALSAAKQSGQRISLLESMCGLPLCLLPGPIVAELARATLGAELGAGELVKPPACTGCALSARCYGLRRGYAAIHGTGELCPVAP